MSLRHVSYLYINVFAMFDFTQQAGTPWNKLLELQWYLHSWIESKSWNGRCFKSSRAWTISWHPRQQRTEKLKAESSQSINIVSVRSTKCVGQMQIPACMRKLYNSTTCARFYSTYLLISTVCGFIFTRRELAPDVDRFVIPIFGSENKVPLKSNC